MSWLGSSSTGWLRRSERNEIEGGETVVIFRVWGTTGTVIALFPDEDFGNGLCSSYEHVGKHGRADYVGVMSLTRPATPNEAKDLLKELRGIGYNLVIRERRVRK